MMTNGLRLADNAFLNSIIDAGLDGLYIPFYSSERTEYNYLVGNDNAYDHYIQGLININNLIKEKSFDVNVKLLLAKFTYKINPNSIKFLASHFPNIKKVSLHGFHISDKAFKRADECVVNYREARPNNDLTIQYLANGGFDFHISEIPLCAFSDSIIWYLLQSGRIAYSDETFLKRPDWKTAKVSSQSYFPEECKSCALFDLCPKLLSKNTDQFDFGIKPIMLSD